MGWIVKSDYLGCPAMWGVYPDKETAEELAKRINGTVELLDND